MKIVEISVYKDRKIQVKQYEPFSFGYGAKAEVAEGDDIQGAYRELESFVDQRIAEETAKAERSAKYDKMQSEPF